MRKTSEKSRSKVDIRTYSSIALPHLKKTLERNEPVLERIVEKIIQNVKKNRMLFLFGSGHSALLSMEIYHRAGGPSFVIPLISDSLLPSAGPPMVRLAEQTPGIASVLLNRAQPLPGEMIWLVSQSGINPTVVELAIQAKKRKMHTVAFTSLAHSQGVPSRHSSKKKLFEICHDVVDLGGVVGDAAVKVSSRISTGPLSTLSSVFLAHSMLSVAIAKLEGQGVRCAYTSVNTPGGELRNRNLEKRAKLRDPSLR